MDMIYFDNSATTKPHKQVIDDMSECMENIFANPSSAHKLGFQAEKRIKQSREKVAALIGADPGQIVRMGAFLEHPPLILQSNKTDHLW
jgi:cysteine desulfurase